MKHFTSKFVRFAVVLAAMACLSTTIDARTKRVVSKDQYCVFVPDEEMIVCTDIP